jgi:hypothetical protein
MDNKMRIRKIHVKTLVETLVNLYDNGVDYVDVIGILDDTQDSIGLSFSKAYMAKGMKKQFDNISEKSVVKDIKIDKKLSDEDLNQLL